MHGPIRDRLEDLLEAPQSSTDEHSASHHLRDCPECLAALNGMRRQADALRTLNCAEELEPGPGFYARVLQRIEERTKDSIWAFFIYSPVSKRLMYASLTLALLLGTYVISRESDDGHLTGSDVTASVTQQVDEEAPVTGSPAEQRDAVLVNFASYSRPLQ